MKFIIYKDSIGEYRWRCRAGNNEIITVSEGYKQKASAKHAINLIRMYASNATVLDITEQQARTLR
ncbi:MAG: DUF1508 domain-containing protein [Candidatus Pacebacteria bacterium]|nr:DUF1508 domain-containing protein [Candidatus Paceibacterota bacterium]